MLCGGDASGPARNASMINVEQNDTTCDPPHKTEALTDSETGNVHSAASSNDTGKTKNTKKPFKKQDTMTKAYEFAKSKKQISKTVLYVCASMHYLARRE